MEKKAVNLGPWATFMFATIMWFFTFMYLGVFQGDNYLMYSVIFAVSLLFWIKAANMYYATGDTYDALNVHYYMAFGILFGGMAGFGFLALYLGYVFPALAQDEAIMGIFYLIGGVFLLPTIPSLFYMDKVSCITYLIATIWLLVGGIWYFNMNSAFLDSVNIYCCTAMTLGIIWMMIDEVAKMCCGKGVPMGKPFKKYPDA